MFGNVDHKIKKIQEDISRLDTKAESVRLNEEEVVERRLKFVELWNALNAKESLLRQKSRIKWIREGDSNYSFFHASLVIRRRRNQMVAILDDNLWVEEVNQLKEEVVNYFSKIYLEEGGERPRLEGV